MLDIVTIKETKKNIGLLSRTLRTRNNLTQEQLGELLGLSRLTIQNLESGKNPTLDTLLKVLQHFDQLSLLNELFTKQIADNTIKSLY
jgi:transcriptional regulator with XRE-family HTH domain